MAVITPSELHLLSPVFKGRIGRLFGRWALWFTGAGKVNKAHQYVEDNGITYGPDAAKGIMDYCGIDYLIGNPERLENLPEGAFITISNHNYGHLDGIMLVDIIGHKRPGLKVMVNKILMWIHCLNPNFISVQPTGAQRTAATTESINGVKQALLTLKEGNPLALFPAGAVADLKPKEKWTISDREWQDAAIKLIMKAKVPIVPIRFFDRNSNFYYLLGLIDWKVRLMRLCHEMFNKRKKPVRLGIGETISVEEQAKYKDPEEFKRFIRSKVYEMPLPEHFTPRSGISL